MRITNPPTVETQTLANQIGKSVTSNGRFETACNVQPKLAAWHSQPNAKTYALGTAVDHDNNPATPLSDEPVVRRSVRYLYHPNGDLWKREWQRTGAGNAGADIPGAGITTTYLHDAWSRLETVSYPAADPGLPMYSATPNVGFLYDAAGRVRTRADGAGTTTYTWKAWGRAEKESLLTSIPGVAQVLADVERTFDADNRPDLLKAKWGTAANMTAPPVGKQEKTRGQTT